MTATYVYGLTYADVTPPNDLIGVDGAPVEVVTCGDLAALVSAAPTERPLGTRDDLLSHERVVDAVARTATVLPMRFGSVIERFGVVDELLAPHLEELGATLSELDGQVQYTVKGQYVREVVLREIVESDQEIAALNDKVRDEPEERVYQERVRLGELVVGELEELRHREGAVAHERLSALASSAIVRSSPDPEQMLDSAFLVPRQRAAEFEDAVERLASESTGRVRYRLGGPLAPYDFVAARE
ncbi:MAG TPA: GvpL/GvpF family gas vesicle protein [Pseudonocardia sp.]